MATYYHVQNPDDTEGEWVGTRWNSGPGQASMEFGANPERVMDLKERIGPNTQVRGSEGWQGTGGDFWKLAESYDWSHGKYGGTSELGSGQAAAFEDLSPDQFRDVTE